MCVCVCECVCELCACVRVCVHVCRITYHTGDFLAEQRPQSRKLVSTTHWPAQCPLLAACSPSQQAVGQSPPCHWERLSVRPQGTGAALRHGAPLRVSAAGPHTTAPARHCNGCSIPWFPKLVVPAMLMTSSLSLYLSYGEPALATSVLTQTNTADLAIQLRFTPSGFSR